MLHSRPLRTLALVTTLACVSSMITASGAERYLTIALEGSAEPTNVEIQQDLTQPGGSTTTTYGTDHVSRSYRLGAIGVARLTPSLPISPTVGGLLSNAHIYDSTNDGDSTTSLLCGDLLGGLSFIPDNHVVFDVLAFTGFGRGPTTSSVANGAYRGDYNPDATLREYGVRGGIAFISDRGWTLMLFGGYKKATMTQDGTLIVSGVGNLPLTTTSSFRGGFLGLDWGVSF